MPRGFDDGPDFSAALPRPSKALITVLIALLALWAMFAVAINWRDASRELFDVFCGSAPAILHGQVWRLFTAPLMHEPADAGHILFTLLGIYFLSPSLEQKWGSARFVRFVFFSAWIAYLVQLLVLLALPRTLTQRMTDAYWYGALPAVDAIAVAWALSFKDQTVRLMFVLPVTGRGMLIFVGAMNVVYLIVAKGGPSGLIAPFGGMFAGWLLGGGTPSPLRRAYLQLRLARLDGEMRRGDKARSQRIQASGLRVIRGGHDDADGKSGSGRDSDPGRWLN